MSINGNINQKANLIWSIADVLTGTYIQVNDRMDANKTFSRELGVLQQIRDSHPKMVLTNDEMLVGSTEDGIKIVSLLEWLLKDYEA